MKKVNQKGPIRTKFNQTEPNNIKQNQFQPNEQIGTKFIQISLSLTDQLDHDMTKLEPDVTKNGPI